MRWYSRSSHPVRSMNSLDPNTCSFQLDETSLPLPGRNSARGGDVSSPAHRPFFEVCFASFERDIVLRLPFLHPSHNRTPRLTQVNVRQACVKRASSVGVEASFA